MLLMSPADALSTADTAARAKSVAAELREEVERFVKMHRLPVVID
jgi:hypothetical protein